MSLWDDTPNTLTVFGPLSSDVTPSGGLLSRLLRRNTNRDDPSPSSSQSESLKSSREASADRDVTLPRQPSISSNAGSSTSEKDESEVQSNQEKVVPQQQQDTRRTLSGVLTRLSNILERRPVTPQAYKDSDFKQYWMPDSSCKECYDCGDKFTTFRRRHHCRICGQIFCSKCCNQELPGKIIGYKGGIRVCTYCGKVALSALQSEPSGDLQVDREDLSLSMDGEQATSGQSLGFWGSKKKDTLGMSSRSNISINMSGASLEGMVPFDLTPMSEYSSLEHFDIDPKILQDSAQLRELWRQLQDPEKGVEMQSHRIRLRTYHKCIVGNRLVDWLMKNDRATQRLQAVAIGQALLDAGYLEVVSGQPQFQDDFTLYKPSKTSPIDQPEELITGEDNSIRKSTEPKWLQEIQCEGDDYYSESERYAERHDTFMSSSTSSKLTTSSRMSQSRKSEEEECKEFEPLPRQDTAGVAMVDDVIAGFTSSQSTTAGKIIGAHPEWRGIENMKEENGEKMAYTRLQKTHQEHLSTLVSHMVSNEGLSKSWIDIIHKTAERISAYVRPDVKQEGDDMDIRKYVHFKKIPGGNKEQTCMVHGVVFTKNVAHKKMSQQITNPRILLLKGSIEYQRVENKFSSLEPQILQEEEFLRKNIAKISSLNPRPDVIIVEKSVSRLAQEYLLESGVTLAFNVKLAVMERIERFTQACIIPSIDGIVSGPIRLGFCHNFKVCNFSIPTGGSKTVLIFDGCATHLGCTVMLRGGTNSELKRIKSIMKLMVYAAYHSHLEISFCMDEFAVPPAGEDSELNLEGFEHSEDSELGNMSKPISVLDRRNVKETYLPTVESGCDLVSMDNETTNQKNDIEMKLEGQSDDEFSLNTESSVQKKSDKDEDSRPGLIGFETANQKDSSSKGENSADDSSETDNAIMNSDSFQLKKVTDSESHVDIKKDEFVNSFKLAINTAVDSETVCESDNEMVTEDVVDKGDNPEEKENKREMERFENIKIESNVAKHVTDHSDPLQNYQKNQDDSIFSSSLTLKEKTQKHCQKFIKVLDEVSLTTSPYVKYKIPYLESEAGSQCVNRKYFPDEIYTSHHFEPKSMQRKSKFIDNEFPLNQMYSWSNIEITEAHPLILCQLNTPLSNKNTQNMLADFRARGGRIKLKQPVSPVTVIKKDQDKSPKNGQLYNDTGVTASLNKKMDCFDFSRHQRLAVLLSSNSEKSANHPYPCLPPQIVTMMFYGSQDITLGGFLEKFCFRESYSCQPYTCPSEACDVPMLDHVRRIVHGDGSVYISLRKLTHCVPGGESAIMMWNWCRKCRQATPLVPMSRDTWNISFAKYLELRFHCPDFTRRASAEPCSHSLHHNCSQYFGHRNIVATFKYYPIGKLEVALPPSVIALKEGITKLQWLKLKEEIKFITNKGTDMYSFVLENVVTMNVDTQSETLSKLVTDFKDMLQNEKAEFRKMADSTRQRVNEMVNEIETKDIQIGFSNQYYTIHDEVIKMKRFLTDAVINWNSKLQELYNQNKKYKQSMQSKRDKESSSLPPSSAEEENKLASSVTSKQSLPEYDATLEESASSSFTEIQQPPSTDITEQSDTTLPIDITVDKVQFPEIKESYYNASVESGTYSVTPGINAGIYQGMPLASNMSPDTNTYIILQQGSFEISAETVNTEDVIKDIAVMVTKEVEEDYGTQDTDGVKPKTQASKNVVKQSAINTNLKKAGSTDDLVDGQADKISGIKKTLTSFWTGTGYIPLLLPFDASEHHLLPTCHRAPVPVYDQEPSSIMAYALSSHDYHQKLQEIQTYFTVPQKDTPGHSPSKMAKSGDSETSNDGISADELAKKNSGKVLSFFRMSKEASPKMSRKTDTAADTVKYVPKVDGESMEADENGFSLLSTTSVTDSDKSKAGKQMTNYHIELQFSDSSARFYCKVYFAEQFRKLRKLIFPAGEEMYIRTLSRCRIWEAKGGKSGSAFCKTHDDRFILKQMSGIEVEIFEKFGPEYFQYVSKSYQEKKPTALAKIVGVYRIGFRNTHTNAAMKQDMLVVENLFYGRKISQKFDLKGSMRNRLVKSSGKREEELVLLDENLLKLSVESPLYIYPHSKAVLMMAINRDSEFLSSNLVMDYSLLVGLDENTKELVVGIIDYIRTFTWDKKLETLIKSVNTGGKMPTVVSPEIYRNRFLEAMGRYFQPVPDQWYGFGKEMES